MIPIFAWWIIIVVGLALSALYSGLETGVYSLNRVRLHVLEHRGDRRAAILRRQINRPTAMLGTLLIGNNLANYMGTGGLAVVLETWGYGPWQTVAINAAIITPLLFVFGETLPKDLFAAHADRLMYPFVRFLDLSRRVFLVTGMLPVIGFLSGLVTRTTGNRERAVFHPRRLVTNLVQEGVGTGLLSDEQSAMVDRVLELSARTAGDEMTPWSDVIRIEADDGPRVLWTLADRTSFSRFPVIENQSIVGVAHVLDALRHGREACPPIRALMRPVPRIPVDRSIRSALAELQQKHSPMAIVDDDHGRPVGIISIKDLVEPLTGELTSW